MTFLGARAPEKQKAWGTEKRLTRRVSRFCFTGTMAGLKIREDGTQRTFLVGALKLQQVIELGPQALFQLGLIV